MAKRQEPEAPVTEFRELHPAINQADPEHSSFAYPPSCLLWEQDYDCLCTTIRPSNVNDPGALSVTEGKGRFQDL